MRETAPALLDCTTVVDDSGDGRVAAALAPAFPSVDWVVHPANLGFGRAATRAVLSTPADLVVLLNDDVELLADPTDALRRAFKDPELFAVTFRALRADGSFREGAKRLAWPLGFPRMLHNPRDQRLAGPGGIPSDYAVGGHAAFHRARFAKLGGFDALYEPFYWEDADLARRAAERGWPCLYLPECLVRHAGESAIRSANDAARIREITLRNRILFAWRHAPAAARPLLAASLAGQRLTARVRRDAVALRAFAAAEARRERVYARPEPLPLAPAAGEAPSISRAAATTSAGIKPVER